MYECETALHKFPADEIGFGELHILVLPSGPCWVQCFVTSQQLRTAGLVSLIPAHGDMPEHDAAANHGLLQMSAPPTLQNFFLFAELCKDCHFKKAKWDFLPLCCKKKRSFIKYFCRILPLHVCSSRALYISYTFYYIICWTALQILQLHLYIDLTFKLDPSAA